MGWSDQIEREMINMPEIDVIQHGERKLYYIRENYKSLVKELLQGGGGSNLPSNTETNLGSVNVHSSINETNASSIPENSSELSSTDNRFCIPLEVMAYMKAFLGDFSPIKLAKLSMTLRVIYKHLSRDYIEVSDF